MYLSSTTDNFCLLFLFIMYALLNHNNFIYQKTLVHHKILKSQWLSFVLSLWQNSWEGRLKEAGLIWVHSSRCSGPCQLAVLFSGRWESNTITEGKVVVRESYVMAARKQPWEAGRSQSQGVHFQGVPSWALPPPAQAHLPFTAPLLPIVFPDSFCVCVCICMDDCACTWRCVWRPEVLTSRDFWIASLFWGNVSHLIWTCSFD